MADTAHPSKIREHYHAQGFRGGDNLMAPLGRNLQPVWSERDITLVGVFKAGKDGRPWYLGRTPEERGYEPGKEPPEYEPKCDDDEEGGEEDVVN